MSQLLYFYLAKNLCIEFLDSILRILNKDMGQLNVMLLTSMHRYVCAYIYKYTKYKLKK